MDKFGACVTTVVQMRKEPSHKSELVSQLLFGEPYQILQKEQDWYYINTVNDSYEGWIDINQSYIIDKNEFSRLNSIKSFRSNRLITFLEYNSQLLNISLGSFLYSKDNFKIGDLDFKFSNNETINENNLFNRIIDNAKKCLNIPYLWGGKTVFGFDCSGFVQVLYGVENIKLPRDASQQEKIGNVISDLFKSQKGDLAFFGNENIITHVGIIINNSEIIHCSGKVKIDKIDKKGIYNIEEKKYTHFLKSIKRIGEGNY